MKIFGKTVSEYAGFEKVFLILVLVVGLARLGLSLAGVADSTARFLSLTVLLLIGMLYYAIRVYTTGFGSYKQLLPVLALQWILSQAIIIAGIIIAIETGKSNIFSAPEYSPRKDLGMTWAHALSHVVAMILGPVVFWLLGSVIMFVTKRIASGPGKSASPAGA